MLHKSIRWRIQAWHGFLLVGLVTGLIAAFYAYEYRQRFGELENQLREAAQIATPRVGRGGGMHEGPGDGPPGGRPPKQSGNAPVDPNRPPRDRAQAETESARVEKAGIYTVGWSDDGQLSVQSDNAPQGLSRPELEQRRPTFRTRNGYRELIQTLPRGEIVLVGTTLGPVNSRLHRLAFGLVIFGILIVGAGMAVGWWIAGRALQPLAEISATAKKITEGDLSRRINVSETENELGQLATVLNGTFDKIERMIEEQLRFTADASHELRTPIAVLITQIQLALSRERSPEEYKQTLETCERAAERLRLLVNQLIELARIDAGDASLVWEKCDLSRVAHDAIEFITPLAHKKNVTLKQSVESIRLKGDVMKLGQVMINLLNNAIHHNKEGIEVSLTVKKVDTKAVILISDNGAGIPVEALPHLFDRFYRVDKARARGKGNSGLGLAICKAIIEGHGGTIRAESELGKGATFIIELPLFRS